ncbi:hypothetical protein M6B38_315880 [Iris pallida]|uniref:Uncharacterized protein n=1 Tax=Iris pallida TaxID=29817 RepID=A0AAX6HF80_IRIPA|nr:hypothetical protein M6B38_315880 [Iris pallida]
MDEIDGSPARSRQGYDQRASIWIWTTPRRRTVVVWLGRVHALGWPRGHGGGTTTSGSC